MKQALIYSLKVWLTSSILATLILGMVNFRYDGYGSMLIFPLSIMFISLMSVLVSSPTWLMFYIASRLIIKNANEQHQKLMILIAAELLTVVTFLIFLKFAQGFNAKVYIKLMFCHCLIMGVSVFYYKLEPASNRS